MRWFWVLFLGSVDCLGPDLWLYEDPGFQKLPPIYRMDDFWECQSAGQLYCEVHLEVEPRGVSSIWDVVMVTVREPKVYFPRNRFRRALCLPKTGDFQENVLKSVEYEMAPLNFTAKILKSSCNKPVQIGAYDLCFLAFVVAYLALVIKSTYKDYERKKKGLEAPADLTITTAFSLLSNWEKFKKLPTNPDYQRLKSFQGMRCVVMFLIVLGHSLYSHMYGYLANPNQVELHFFMYFFQMLMIMGMFQVQIYLFMSGFLLGLQVLTMADLFKGFHLRQVVLMLVNRFLRLAPVVGAMIAFHTSSYPLLLLRAPMASKLIERTDNCKENWWKTLFFIHNNDKASKMCESGTWYIGVDSQMYAISLVVMFLVVKYKLGYKFLLKLVALCITVYGFLIFYFQTDMYCRIMPEKLQFGEAEHDFTFQLLYMSTYSSASTFFIGILFGWFYYKNKDLKVNAKIWFLPWLALFLVLPWYVLHFTIGETTPLWRPIFGALLKPIFAFGVGCGLLGMAFGVGGPIKKFFEWKYFEYFANITFSLYIFHFDLVFPRSLTIDKPLFLTKRLLVQDFIQDFFSSIGLGFAMYLGLELPCANLLKILLKDVVDKEKRKIKKVD